MPRGKVITSGAVCNGDPEKFDRVELTVSRLKDLEGDTITINDGCACFVVKTEVIKQLIEETER